MTSATAFRLVSLAWALSPLVLGLAIGFAIAVAGIWRWFAGGATPAGRNLVAALRREGIQFLAGGVLLTWAAAAWLYHAHASHVSPMALQAALCAYPLGVAAGVRWVCLRGER